MPGQATSDSRSLRHALICARGADEYRGKEIVVLDLRSITPVFDFFVIVSAGSPRQMRAIADEVDRLMKAAGSSKMGAEGRESSTWILHDYGDVVLHIFSTEARENYDLERLWADAPVVDWQRGDSTGDAGVEPAKS